MACCFVKAAVIWDAYRGFANMSTPVDLLVVVLSHDGGGEDDGDGGVNDDDATARCFPLSDLKAGVWLFAP